MSYGYKELLEQMDLEPNSEEEMDFLEEQVHDSLCIGICKSCGNIQEPVEPDARNNWCDVCENTSVESALSLKGLI